MPTNTTSQKNTASKNAALSSFVLLAASVAAYWEGYSPTGYSDPVGIPTVCWGHTGPDVRVDMVMSLEQCKETFEKDLLIAAASVQRCITRPLSVGQAAAFTSFTFNVGGRAFCNSTLVRLFNAGREEDACNQMSRWVFAKGVRLRGLERRRVSEVSMCLYGTWTPPDGSIPTSPLGKAGLVPHVVASVGLNDVIYAVLLRPTERRFLPVA